MNKYSEWIFSFGKHLFMPDSLYYNSVEAVYFPIHWKWNSNLLQFTTVWNSNLLPIASGKIGNILQFTIAWNMKVFASGEANYRKHEIVT